MAKIEAFKYTVLEAFRECFYVVPDYQREYVWQEKQVQQLLEDIDEQIGASTAREYFVGTILVSPNAGSNQFEVIDGQQRLTTFFLLLCALKHRFREQPQILQGFASLISAMDWSATGEAQVRLRLEPKYDNAEELIRVVANFDGDPHALRAAIQAAGIPQFGSLDNLVAAYQCIHSYLDNNHKDMSKLRHYWGYLANSVVFIRISTDLSNALKIFETINERGVGLNPMDLLKNLLFRNVRPDQFSQLRVEWKKITTPLESAKEKPLRFLRYFIMASYPVRSPRGDKVDAVVREDEIYDWFTDKQNAALCGYETNSFEFVRKMLRSVEHYMSFIKGCGNDGVPNTPMETLKLLCGNSFSLHQILLLAAANFPKSLFDYFIGQLENFLFYYIFTKTPTRDLERNFSLWADELREIAAIGDPGDQAQRLNTFVSERFAKNMEEKEAELLDDLKRYSLASMQQYRTRYLLTKLTQHVDMAFKGLSVPGSLREYDGAEIEHILPNNPLPELREMFSKGTPERYDEYKSKLGNLALLEKPINIVASNNFFALKLPLYAKTKYYLTSSIAEITVVGHNSSINRINENLKSFETWNTSSIDDRQQILIELAKEIWRSRPLQVARVATA